MKVVVLDANTLANTDVLDFSAFHRRGEVVFHDNLSDPQAVIKETADATVIVLNKVLLNAETISKLSDSIKLIAITATGYDNVDIDAATKRGIKVVNVPGYGTHAVAQLTMMFVLACAVKLVPQIDYMRDKGWSKQAGLSIRMHELAGKTLGVIGLGDIGTAVVNLGLAFGMNVIAHNRTPKHIPNVIMTRSVREVAARADFLTLHCALTDETANMINAEFISHMKPTAYLINTSRGGLVDELALADALANKKIAGAALDVMAKEPPENDNPLLIMENVILTPHIGWAPIETRQRCIDITESNITSFTYGLPTNLLN